MFGVIEIFGMWIMVAIQGLPPVCESSLTRHLRRVNSQNGNYTSVNLSQNKMPRTRSRAPRRKKDMGSFLPFSRPGFGSSLAGGTCCADPAS